ncbi:MAG: FeoB-associated Cys-rich membrane protein [Clostridia bacterium]|nr:FeoB-associated Cys-rich membrane protein [Clostridia bacterium]
MTPQGIITTVVVVLMIALLFVRSIYKMVKNAKAGRGLDGGCTGDCAHCGMGCASAQSDSCHPNDPKSKSEDHRNKHVSNQAAN